MRALLIRPQWLEMILNGTKTWEIRGSKTSIRGAIALIPSGSGTIVGLCDLVDYIGPLTDDVFRNNASKAGMRADGALLGWYRKTYAWVLANPRCLRKPVMCIHPVL